MDSQDSSRYGALGGLRLSSRAADVVVVAAVLAVVGALMRSTLAAPIPSDQMSYMEAAAAMPSVGPPGHEHQYLRLGLIIPLRVVQELFGYSEVAYHLVPILASLLLAVATYLIGRLLVGRWVGAGAALIVVGNGALLPETTYPMPDILSTALFTSAVALALALHQRRRVVTASARRKTVTLAMIGVFIGWAYLNREFTLFLWPVIAVLLWRRVRVRDMVWLVAPVIASFGLELVYGALTFDDPLARARAISAHGTGEIPEDLAETYQNKPRSEYLMRLPDQLRAEVAGGLPLRDAVWIPLGAGVVFIRRLWPLVLWAALLWIPLSLFGGVLDPSQPKLRIQKLRYWYPIFPAIAVAALAGVWLMFWYLGRLRSRPGTGGAVVKRIALPALATATASAIILGTAGVVAYRAYDNRPPNASAGRTDLDAFRDWLHTEGQDVEVIWTDRRSARILPLYQVDTVGRERWDGVVRTWKGDAKPGSDETVVLISAPRPTGDGNICRFCHRASRDLLGSPTKIPPGWTQVFATSDNEVQVWRTP